MGQKSTQRLRKSRLSPRFMSPFLGILTRNTDLNHSLKCPFISGCIRVCLGVVSRKNHANSPGFGIVQADQLRMAGRGLPARCQALRKRFPHQGRGRCVGQ